MHWFLHDQNQNDAKLAENARGNNIDTSKILEVFSLIKDKMASVIEQYENIV